MLRIIKLKCIKDDHIVEFKDTGVDREGQPTGQRQAIARALSKRIPVVDGGKESNFPIFLVHEVGEWSLGPNERLPNGDEFLAFEDDVVRREHPEHMIEQWTKAQAKFIAESIESRRQAERRLESEQSADLAKTMREMMRAYGANAAPSKKGAANV